MYSNYNEGMMTIIYLVYRELQNLKEVNRNMTYQSFGYVIRHISKLIGHIFRLALYGFVAKVLQTTVYIYCITHKQWAGRQCKCIPGCLTRGKNILCKWLFHTPILLTSSQVSTAHLTHIVSTRCGHWLKYNFLTTNTFECIFHCW